MQEKPKSDANKHFPITDMTAGMEVKSGLGTQYHAVGRVTLGTKDVAAAYVKQTGLTQVEPGNTGARVGLMRSRRGSIAGVAPKGDGTWEAWRMSSYPTSQALREKDDVAASSAFVSAANTMMSSTTNSAGKNQTTNVALSDFMRVRHGSEGFVLDQITHAQGVSGTGLANKTNVDTKDHYYAPSASTQTAHGNSVTAAQTFHSEPMAVTLNNEVREDQGWGKMSVTTGMVGVVSSFPNQICNPCGRMLSREIGPDGYVSGASGREFGGQKAGLLDRGAVTGGTGDAYKSVPMATQVGTENQSELQAIRAYHGHIDNGSGS